jgi:hypothetical protein
MVLVPGTAASTAITTASADVAEALCGAVGDTEVAKEPVCEADVATVPATSAAGENEEVAAVLEGLRSDEVSKIVDSMEVSADARTHSGSYTFGVADFADAMPQKLSDLLSTDRTLEVSSDRTLEASPERTLEASTETTVDASTDRTQADTATADVGAIEIVVVAPEATEAEADEILQTEAAFVSVLLQAPAQVEEAPAQVEEAPPVENGTYTNPPQEVPPQPPVDELVKTESSPKTSPSHRKSRLLTPEPLTESRAEAYRKSISIESISENSVGSSSTVDFSEKRHRPSVSMPGLGRRTARPSLTAAAKPDPEALFQASASLAASDSSRDEDLIHHCVSRRDSRMELDSSAASKGRQMLSRTSTVITHAFDQKVAQACRRMRRVPLIEEDSNATASEQLGSIHKDLTSFVTIIDAGVELEESPSDHFGKISSVLLESRSKYQDK